MPETRPPSYRDLVATAGSERLVLIQYVKGALTKEEARIVEQGVTPGMLTAITLGMIWNDMPRLNEPVMNPETFEARTPHDRIPPDADIAG